MNCKDFESVVNDLARASVMDASARQEAAEHAESCQRCAACLQDERTLTYGLRALGASFSELNAPASTEEALLSAFHNQKTANHAAVNHPPHSRWNKTRWFVGAAAAAAAFLLMMTSVLPLIQRANEQQKAERASIAEASTAEPDRMQNAPVVDTSSALAVEPESIRSPLVHDASGVTPRMRRNPRIWPTNISDRANPGSASVEEQEFTTDFIPLNYEAAIAPLDRGRVVRVELPRSALAAFGLPVNMDRANERVKADVVLGEDGLARAIRFVR
ncbi:MAG TPA: hypothetical protein VK619_07660 [Pyrinomonadaceae bacterium]|nr:hypothetical protein [Pyrinomonadaceae bacterium]